MRDCIVKYVRAFLTRTNYPLMSEADDVLDFINSLPDSKSGTPQPSKKANDEELLDFLDELAEQDKLPKVDPKVKAVKKVGGSLTPKLLTRFKQDQAKSEADTSVASVASAASAASVASVEPEAPKVEEQLLTTDDMVASLSSWWGSGKGLLGSLASNAQEISEKTYNNALQITNELNRKRQEIMAMEESPLDSLTKQADINGLGSRLNNLLSNVSQQITLGLMDEDDELLNILLVYDSKLNFVDQIATENFRKVMSQVEGGIAVNVTNFNHLALENEDSKKTDLDIFYGKQIDGDKLCLANLELLIKDYQKLTAEQTEKQAHLEEIKLNQLNLFLCIQPICDEKEKDEEIDIIDSSHGANFVFSVTFKDITNNISIATKSQPFPLRWAKWINGEGLEEFDTEGDVDPGQWVREWIRKGLLLAFGVIAQEYVIRRMGY